MLKKAIIGHLPVLGAVILGAVAAWSIGQLPQDVHAQSSPARICRAAIIIDRSGSVGGNMPTLKEQVRRLFQPTGLYDDRIHIAFWTFSHAFSFFGPLGNYNAPYFGYVTSRGETSGFMSALSQVQPSGNTNYQQAFAYDGTTRNPVLNDIIEATDIIVFMTDGQPNSVNQSGVNAEDAGRIAAQNHINAGRFVIGGSIGASSAQVRVINYVVSNDRNNYNNTFTVSTNYNDLAIKLKQQIGTKCDQLFPPDPCPYNEDLPIDDPNCVPPPADPPYSLTPVVNADSTVISSDESAGFSYQVTNNTPENATGSSGWSITQVIVGPQHSADPLLFGSDPYRDGYNCQALLGLVGGNIDGNECNPNVAQGTKQFPPGATNLTASEVGSASRLVIDPTWAVGTKVCYLLVVAKPTEKDSPVNRHSKAVCVVVGKRPTVQVWGGDLNVGGLIPGDPEAPNPLASKIQTGLTIKGDPVNRVFGSWVEYGAFAPGPIIGLASASGLESGYPATVGALQGLWSELTFANENDEYGSFADARTMPNTAQALLTNQTITPITADTFDLGTANSGVYEKATGDLTLSGAVLGKGKAVTIHVPEGTVTIDGNLGYTGEDLSSIDEIPRLVIIAKNINIKAAVTHIDGWLIARNSPTGSGGGIINTCSDGPADLTINDCNQQLRINGAVMARYLLLRRTAGAGPGAESDRPGEIINLRADAYLSSIARRTDITVPMTTYSVELPPRF